MGIESEWKNRGIRVGKLPCGPLDKISDVPGVTVGHCTLSDGEVQTGVTALLPHPGDIFHDKVMAASHVINGFGKTTGLVQIEELGTLETPILFTNTLSVGTVETALVKYMLDRNPDICETTGSVNPVVCECNDLVVAGTPIQTLLDASIPPHEDKGSIITVLATDIPLSERQLRRLCHRALVGLSRTGSFCGNGSGEIVIAFTTANRVPHDSEKAILPMGMVHDDAINPLFRAVAECVEESVLSSLLHAETVTGHHGRTVKSLRELLNL